MASATPVIVLWVCWAAVAHSVAAGAVGRFTPWLRFAQATAALAVLLAAAALAFWLLKRMRGSEAEDTLAAHKTLSKFRELHARGGLSDEEFRTIQTKLARQLEGESGDTPEGDGLRE